MHFNQNKIKILISVLILLQLFLISHRVSFDYRILLSFYKKDVAVLRSIKEKDVIEVGNFLKTIEKDFYFEKNFLKRATNEYEYNSPDTVFYQRIVEYLYPIKLNKDSNIIISNNNKLYNCKKIYKYKKKNVYDCKK